MSHEAEQAILDAYAGWDPVEATTEDLIDELGISRTTLYNVLRRNGVALKTRGGFQSRRPEVDGDMLGIMAATALDALFTRLRDAEDRAAYFEDILRQLLEAHPSLRRDELVTEALSL